MKTQSAITATSGAEGMAPESSLQEAANETEALGQLMADAFARAVSYSIRYRHKTRADAESEALAPAPDEFARRILNAAPERVTYLDMVKLQSKDPALAAERWITIRQRALESWRSGENHVRALCQTDQERVWRMANFLVVREALSEGNPPRNGIEQELLNQMAQVQILQMDWLQILTERTNRDFIEEVGILKKLRPPEVSQEQAVEHAAAMVERLQKLFLRLQRAFQESRKLPPVVVQNAGQVNVANQQVNIARDTNPTGCNKPEA